ncbi:MAG: FAD-dependent oxidoreductase [Candidatus Saccharimonadales bacterium]
MKKVVVVGGGFGGIKAALELANNQNFNVTLVSDRLSFRYYPSLYHTATGGRRVQTDIPLQRIFDQKNVTLLQGEAKKLHRTDKQLELADGSIVVYDTLILSLGVVTNYFGIEGLESYSYGIKSVEQAEELKAHLHEHMLDEGKPDANYLVVGGGPTGIELAGALPAYIKQIMKNHGVHRKAVNVTIIEAMPQLLPRLPKKTSKAVQKRLRKLGVKVLLGQKVEGQNADALVVNGKPIKSNTVVWTAGVTNHPFFKKNNFALNERGKVTVNQLLAAEDDIYVLGDNAATPFSGLAQTALHDAISVTANLKLEAAGKSPKIYTPKPIVSVIPVGEGWAAVNWGKLKFGGSVGWALRSAADWIAFKDLEPFWQATAQWATEFGDQEYCTICSTPLKNKS